MVGGFFATNIGSTMPFGMEGWRFAFHLMAAVSIVTSALVFYVATDPRPTAKVHVPSALHPHASLLWVWITYMCLSHLRQSLSVCPASSKLIDLLWWASIVSLSEHASDAWAVQSSHEQKPMGCCDMSVMLTLHPPNVVHALKHMMSLYLAAKHSVEQCWHITVK